MILEPDVTLTDYLLAAECLLFVLILKRRQKKPMAPVTFYFILFFFSVGFAALTGGTVHGFFPEKTGPVFQSLWRATLASLGLAAFSAWLIGASMLFSKRTLSWFLPLAAVEFMVYLILVIFRFPRFSLAVLNYFPAAVFLLIAFLWTYLKKPQWRPMAGVLGMGLILGGALLQQASFGFPGLGLTPNALFHLLQMAAVALLFLVGIGETH